MPAILNKHFHPIPKDAVYIGRPSKWGNLYSHLPNTQAEFAVATRAEAVQKYMEYLLDNPDLVAQAKKELAGKDLVCWCAPHLCHGHILERVANDLPLPLHVEELLPPKPPKPEKPPKSSKVAKKGP